MYYPIQLDVSGLHVVIVGGGKIAYRKALAFVRMGKTFTVVSKSFSRDFSQLASEKITFIQGAFDWNHLKDADLVIAATDDANLNAQIGAYAKQRGKLVNVVSDSAYSNFLNAAVIKNGDLVLTVSTAGKSPKLAKQIKNELENLYGEKQGRTFNVDEFEEML